MKFKPIILVFIISFFLNFIWENLHHSLYSGNIIGINNYFLLMIYASFVDAFWITAVFSLISIIDKDTHWRINWTNGILFSILLITISLTIEKIALATGRWGYSQLMPIVFGVGLLPLIQLVITGWISILITRRILK